MDWNLLIAATALAVTVVVATINYAALDDTKRDWVSAFWKKVFNVGAVVVAVGISVATILSFWLSDEPMRRSAVVVLGLHFFNLGIWTMLWLLSIAAKSMADAKGERKALQNRVAALEVQMLAKNNRK